MSRSRICNMPPCLSPHDHPCHCLYLAVYDGLIHSGRKLVERPMQRGLALMTRIQKNMKVMPMSMADKMLLNKRDVAETIIGHIKEGADIDSITWIT